MTSNHKRQFGRGRPQKPRRGWSIMEQIFAITVGSVVLGILYFSMLGVLRMQQGIRDRGDAQRDLLRLAAQFRADVHRSQKCDRAEPAAAKFALVRQGSPTIQYAATDDGTIARRVELPDGPSREMFSFPAGTSFGLESTSGAILTLRIEMPGPGETWAQSSKRVWRIVAALDSSAKSLELQGLRLP